MMKLLIPFSIVPDLEALSERDWGSGSDLKIDTTFAPLDWNSFDESALELSLKLSDPSESFLRCMDYERTAMTIGGQSCEPFLKTLAALKFDRLIRVDPGDADLRFCPEAVSQIIVTAAQTLVHPDFLLMGRQKQVGDNACTPLVAAEMLGWPCITQAVHMEAVGENKLRVISTVDGGTVTQTVSAPCVLSVGDVPDTYLRVPTLKDKMKYGKKAITRLDLSDFPAAEKLLAAPDRKLCSLTPIHKERAGIVIDAATPEEKAEILYQNYLKGRLKQL